MIYCKWCHTKMLNFCSYVVKVALFSYLRSEACDLAEPCVLVSWRSFHVSPRLLVSTSAVAHSDETIALLFPLVEMHERCLL